MPFGWNLFDRPNRQRFAITPSNSANLARLTRQIVVGTGGDVRMDIASAGRIQTVTVTLAAGTHNYAAIKVYSTGTTASGLVGIA
jgi:hypothetical protein